MKILILDVLFIIIFLAFFLFGFFIIYKQVALVKKGEFNVSDRLQCIIYGIIFSIALMVVIAMAFIFAVQTPEFWENSSFPPPDINPLALIIPFIICLAYISFYPLIDFLFIAVSEESDEGLTPFHKLIGNKVINISKSKYGSVIMAILLYCLFIIPPVLLSLLGFSFLMIFISWMLVYPMMILTFYGSKGYIAGISNCYYNIPDIRRSIFLNFEDSKRGMKQFASNPASYIVFGLMIFVFIWAWISMIQTITFFFTGKIAISTMTSVFVFVTLFFGIMGYFTRFWGRKIKYRGIDIYFAAYLMAAIGINVLVNFLIVNPNKLFDTFNMWDFTDQIIPNYRMFAWAAVIEEIILIIFTSYFFLAKKNKFIRNIKYSRITECGNIFNPIPLFNFIKNKNLIIRKHAEETLILMFERIPLKAKIDLNKLKFKHFLFDALCDYHSNARRISYNILLQLEKDVPDIVLPWIIEGITSPNYDKSIPIARSLLKSEISLLENIPENAIFSLIEDPEWRLKQYGLMILSRLVHKKNDLILNLNIHELVNDSNSKVQVEILNLLSESSIELPVHVIIKKINHSNKEIRAAAIKNVKNIKIENIDSQIINILLPLMKDPTSSVRASIFEVFAKIGNFKKFSIPISPFLDGLTDYNENVRSFSVLALEKYSDEEPGSINLDVIINKIDPNNNEVLSSVLSLLGRLWEKNPEKIITIFLIFIKFDNEKLKKNISKILVEKYQSHPDLIIQNLINISDVSKFISKGIISTTIIKIAKADPQNMISKLIIYLNSNNVDTVLNAISSLDGLIDEFFEMISIKPLLSLMQKDMNNQIKKEASKLISKIAKTNPFSIKPFIPLIFQIVNDQEQSVKIVLSKSILEIAKTSPELIPVRSIIPFFSDQDSFIRESGAKILGFIGFELVDEVIDVLINKGLTDEEWIVREASVASLGKIVEHVENKEFIIKKLVYLLDDDQNWVRRSAMNILSNIKEVTASQIPFEKVASNLTSSDPKVREGSVGLLKIYSFINIDRVFDDILTLLGDDSEVVRKKMINTTVEIINKIGLSKILSKLLKNLSDEGSLETQQSIALILRRTAKYEDKKIKKRIISLLKIRCEMSQDPIICQTLQELRES